MGEEWTVNWARARSRDALALRRYSQRGADTLVCCIYNKPRAFDESSSESGSDSEHDHDHGHDHAGPASGKAKGKGRAVMRRPDATGAGEEEMSEPSSESDGGGGDGRARCVVLVYLEGRSGL